MSQWEQASAVDSGQLPSIGAYLAAQRGIRGITLDELAQLTRIPIRSLERLEAGLYDGVTDGFVRGFVRTVAASLGLEPDDTVARMLREPSPQDEAGAPLSPLLRRALAATAMLGVLALAAGVIRAVVSSSPLEEIEASEQVFRRDSVRLLADAQREAAGSWPVAQRLRSAGPPEDPSGGDPPPGSQDHEGPSSPAPL
jgi:cytoskeleton protein RodZ